MKLTTTTTLIIIAAIKWTLQTSHPHKDVTRVNGDGMMEGHTSHAPVIVRSSSYCQSEEDGKKIVQVVQEHVHNLSEQETPKKKRHFFGRFSRYLEEQQISKKPKMDEESSVLPVQETIKENNAEGRTGSLAKRNSSTEKRTVSQQQPSVIIVQPTTTKHSSMECAESSQEIESSHKKNLKKPSQSSIEVASEKKVKMNDGSILHITHIQSKPETSLNTSLESTNSNENTKNIWSWIKNRIMQNKNVYTDFCTPQIYKEIFNSEKVAELTGYYNGFADDLKEYIEKHRPRTEVEKKDQEAESESIREDTLGDIYMKQELNSDAIEKCKTSSEKRSDHKSLANKAQTILNIPEIYQNLKSMPDNTFTETLENVKKSKDSLTPIQVELLKYLYSKCHSKDSESNSNEYLSPLENAIMFTGRSPSSYSREELYKEAYKAMVVFYKNADYSYEDEDTGKTIEMMGKDVIVEQVCMKCEATVAKDANARHFPFRITSAVKYTAMSHHWIISTKIPAHYHIQFVDNSLHTLRRVCLPFFENEHSRNAIYFHTISDIIKYLEKIYNIEETGKIYPLKIKENGSTWQILTDDEKKCTIRYFNETKKFSVVFYYIKEGLESKPFTLSVFKGPGSQQKDKQLIPLFLSPFMECAMEQLGLYRKEEEKEEKEYDSAENQRSLLKGNDIKPCVYEYTKPVNDNPGSETIYSQTQLYYSTFYVDEKIKEHTELCPILSASIQRKKTGKHEITWYVRAQGSPQEYIHYFFYKPNGSGKHAGQSTIITILTSLKEKNRTTNNPAYAFYTAKRKKIPYEIFFFQQEDKEIDKKHGCINTLESNYQIIAFKTFNPTKSDLGIHREIFRVLLNSTISSANEEILS